jgi:PAS domain S-box-containing protein
MERMAPTPRTTRYRPKTGVSSAARVADLGSRRQGTDPLEEACVRLCRLVARVLQVPAVLVALKDEDRPFLAGSVGLEGTEPHRWWGETPLSLAISDQAVPEAGALVVNDLAALELLAADPLCREHGFRALLAVPLDPGPTNFGTLCVLAREPRAWSGKDAELLHDVGASVVTEIQLRGSVRQIRAVEEATSRATRRSFVGLIDSIDAVVHERRATDGVFTFVSKRAEALFGHPVERWTDEPTFWRDVIVHPDDRDAAVRVLESIVAQRQAETLEYRALTADGRTLWVRDSLSLVERPAEGTLVRGVMVDLSRRKETEVELQRKNRLLELLRDLSMLANEGALEEGLRFALDRLCAYTGWPVGHVWTQWQSGVDRATQPALEPAAIWHLDDPARYGAFRDATDRLRLAQGDGLPGEVVESAAPRWMSPLDERHFPRRDAAAGAGLRTGFAFPVMSGRDVLAVVELFTPELLGPDDGVLEVAAHAGALLGRVMERRRASRVHQVQDERTRLLLQTAHDPFVAMDDDDQILDWNPAAERLFGWTQDEAVVRRLSETLIPERFRAEHLRGVAHFLRSGEGPLLNRRVELTALRRDGGEVPVEMTISPLRVGERWYFHAFLHDISERLAAEDERRRRENLLAQTQRLARIGSWEWDIAADSISWSDELHRMFGTDPEGFDPSFEAYLARLPEADRQLARDEIGRALGEQGAFEFDHRIVLDNGETHWVRSRGQVLADASGQPVRMLGTAQDVTEEALSQERERQLMREQAARAEAEAAQGRIRQILESLTDAFIAADRDLRITFTNSAAERVLAGSTDELNGCRLAEVLPSGSEAILGACEEALASGESTELAVRLTEAQRWAEVRIFPSPNGLSLYLHDATDRRRAEEQVRSSESRYRFLADSVPQQIWTANPEGRLEYVNRVVLDYTGRPFERMLADGWEAVIHPDDVAGATERWNKALGHNQPFELETRLRNASGQYRWHLCRARCQTASDGGVIRWFGANTDIHDQKELEAARDQALDDLERVTHLLSSERTNLELQARELRRFARALKKSNEDLDRFAYVASHDLKAPLRGIANLTEWLVDDLRDKLTPETTEYARLLQNRVQRMEALIDGILQYSRAGRSRDEPEQIDVGELVRDVVELISPPSQFEIRFGAFWPTLRTERTPLQQVFMNLIGNAIKHADGERPVIDVWMRDEGEDFCEFSVSDNGPGIAAEYHDRIFQIFQTLKARDEVEGTGIGLSVVKRTVENQGGQVWVESDVGKGATFSFLWPRTPEVKERTLG